MNFCLLTRFHKHNEASSFVHRLVEEAEKQGHSFHVINPRAVSFDLSAGVFPVRYRGQDFPDFDLVHYALRWDDDHTWEITDLLRSNGRAVLPSRRIPMGDMVTMARLFARRNIRTPRTWVFARADDVQLTLNEVTFPCLFRVREDSRGRKILIARHSGEMLDIARNATKGGKSFLVQEFVEPMGEDIRVMVVGKKVVAAVRRIAPEGFIRPREDGNPRVEAVQLSPAEEQFVLEAAETYQAPYAAVSFVRAEADGQPTLLEASRAPALSEMENTTGVNIAAAILELCIVEAARLAKK